MEARERYHHGALRQALIAEAFRALESQGLEGLSLRSIAEATGVSKTAPYRHFSDKNALLATLAAEGFRLLAEALELSLPAHAGREPAGGIKALCRAYVDFAIARPALYKLMFSSLGYGLHSESCAAYSARAMGALVSAVAEAQAGGWKRDADGRALVLSLWAEVHGWAGLLVDELIPPELAPAGREWESMAEVLLG